MKVNSTTVTMAALIITALAMAVGCKYDVAEPLWDKPYETLTSSTITSVVPDQEAGPGINIITINGSNFDTALDTTTIHAAQGDTAIAYNGIYFGNIRAEVTEFSSTSIKVRRPNLVSDTCTIKIVPAKVHLEAKYYPYKIDPVISEYGGFNDNTALSAAAIDNAQNIYVIDQTNQNRIYKITPDGSNFYDTTQSALPRFPRDAVVGPDGRLYLIGQGTAQGNANITAVDVSTHPYQWSIWRTMTGKSVRFGDFDANGYFYAGGGRTDLMIIAPDSSNRASGMYATGTSGDSILAVRVYGSYLYVAARLGTTEKGVWRHIISPGGVLGARELYLDFKSDTVLANRTIRSIAMTANGTMYICTDHVNPLLVVDPVTKKMDYFYKNIVPSFGKFLFWGNGNQAYLMCGNASPAQEWKFYKVDMGVTGAGK